MRRTSIERMNNIYGHRYRRERDIYVCQRCGAAEHRSGKFWYAGRSSKSEPPCCDDINGQGRWFLDASSQEIEISYGH